MAKSSFKICGVFQVKIKMIGICFIIILIVLIPIIFFSLMMNLKGLEHFTEICKTVCVADLDIFVYGVTL